MAVFYACPHCYASRLPDTKKEGNKTVYTYECGTELVIERSGCNFIPEWKPKCQYESHLDYSRRREKK